MGQKLFDSAVKARAIEAVPIEKVKPGIDFVIKISNKKKRERNAYYIRRGLREGFLEQRKHELLQIAEAPPTK
jgi:coenzyme F420-reducing hydrogenase beta subunit